MKTSKEIKEGLKKLIEEEKSEEVLDFMVDFFMEIRDLLLEIKNEK